MISHNGEKNLRTGASLTKGLQVRIPKILPSMQRVNLDTYAYAQMPVINVYADVSSRASWLIFGLSLHLLPYFIWEH